MTNREIKPSKIAAAAGVAIALTLGGAQAFADQVSIDDRILQAFQQIDGRTRSFSETEKASQAELNSLAEQINELIGGIESGGTPADESERASRRQKMAKLTHVAATYLSKAYKLLDGTAEVIGRNLSELAQLAERVRRSEASGKGVEQLQERISRGIAKGKAMRDALAELQTWAAGDPEMAGRVDSLKRLMKVMDRTIDVDRAQLAIRSAQAGGAANQRRLKMIDNKVDALADQYIQVTTEGEALAQLREEVALSVQLGRLDLTNEVAERAMGAGPKEGVRFELPSLLNVTTTLSRLNDLHLTETNDDGGDGLLMKSGKDPFASDGFKNF